MSEVVILSAQRTPIGSFMGQQSSFSAPQLGSAAIKGALAKAGVKPDQISQCIMGQVLTAGTGQAPARQAALGAGLPTSVPCMTINKVCGSGLKAVMLGADALRLGDAEVVVAGGQEAMSQVPYLLEQARGGYRMGNGQVVDALVKDGLWDPYNNFHMGTAAELCVKENKITRQEQDEFAKQSYLRAQKAMADGIFKDEIVPLEMSVKGQKTLIATDEEPGKAKFDKMVELRPAFDKEGTITAANASKINDGAAAVVLSTMDYAKKHNLKPRAKILGQATFAQDPKWFTTAPVGAMKDVLKKLNLTAEDIDLFEINEAFSVVTQVAMKELNIPHEKVNVYGGAVALGHPIGASGARVLVTLLNALEKQNKKRGLATLCIGGGEAVAVVVERI